MGVKKLNTPHTHAHHTTATHNNKPRVYRDGCENFKYSFHTRTPHNSFHTRTSHNSNAQQQIACMWRWVLESQILPPHTHTSNKNITEDQTASPHHTLPHTRTLHTITSHSNKPHPCTPHSHTQGHTHSDIAAKHVCRCLWRWVLERQCVHPTQPHTRTHAF